MHITRPGLGGPIKDWGPFRSVAITDSLVAPRSDCGLLLAIAPVSTKLVTKAQKSFDMKALDNREGGRIT